MSQNWDLEAVVSEKLRAHADPAVLGQITIEPRPDKTLEVWLAVRPGLSEDQARRVKEWAEGTLDRLWDSFDPEYHGWVPSQAPGRWYLVAVEHELPDLG